MWKVSSAVHVDIEVQVWRPDCVWKVSSAVHVDIEVQVWGRDCLLCGR